MRELKRLRGLQVTLAGSNAVNDIKALYPDLFPLQDMEQIYVKFPEQIQISIVSSDYIDSDYNTIQANAVFTMHAISFSNIKIKSSTIQTGFIYTAGI